jgi:anti-anti-sigma factor
MNIVTATFKNTRVVQLSGELDAQSVTTLEQQCPASFWVGAEPIAIDLTHVSFIDSSGIGMLVFLVKRLWSNDHLVSLTGLHGQPARLLTMLRIHQSIPCYESVEAYINAQSVGSVPTNSVESKNSVVRK